MLPSKAKVGDTIHFSFTNEPGKTITGFDVVINGKKVKDAEFTVNRAKGGSATYIYNVTAPGIYQFQITPIGQSGERGEPRLNTLEVSAIGAD
jgi:hypothetical protein